MRRRPENLMGVAFCMCNYCSAALPTTMLPCARTTARSSVRPTMIQRSSELDQLTPQSQISARRGRSCESRGPAPSPPASNLTRIPKNRPIVSLSSYDGCNKKLSFFRLLLKMQASKKGAMHVRVDCAVPHCLCVQAKQKAESRQQSAVGGWCTYSRASTC